MAMQMTKEEYRECRDDYSGYCTECNDITNYGVEPDAERYECENCGNDTVMGIENALIEGEIVIYE